MDIEYDRGLVESQSDHAAISAKSFLTVQNLGDLTVEDYIKNVPIRHESFLMGIDSASNVIWMFYEREIKFCRYQGETFDKQTFQFYDIRKSKLVCPMRPVLFGHNDSFFAILSTGGELIGVKLFTNATSKTIFRLADLAEEEFILQMSNAVASPFNHETVFCSITNFGAVYLHRISPALNDTIEITSKRIVEPAGGESYSGFQFKNILSSIFGKKAAFNAVRKAKPVLSEDLVLSCLIEDKMINFKIDLQNSNRPCRELWNCNILSSELTAHGFKLVDAVVAGHTESGSLIFSLVRAPSRAVAGKSSLLVVPLIFNESSREVTKVPEYELIEAYDEIEEAPAYGKIVTFESTVVVVLKEGENNTVFISNFSRQEMGSGFSGLRFCQQLLNSPIVGVSVLTIQDKLQLAIFNHDGRLRMLKEAINDPRARMQSTSVSQLFHQRPRFPERNMKQLGDLVINGFHDFHMQRTSGIIRSGLEFEAEYLDKDLISRMLAGIVTNVSSNLTVVKAVNQPQDFKNSQLVKFDLDLRLRKVQELKNFLKMNKIYGQATLRGKLAFLEAEEILTATKEFREMETKHQGSIVFKHKLIESLEIYEKPKLLVRLLTEIIWESSHWPLKDKIILEGLLLNILNKVQAVRKREMACDHLDRLHPGWWLQAEDFLVDCVANFLDISAKNRETVSDKDRQDLQLCKYIITELEYAVRNDPSKTRAKAAILTLYEKISNAGYNKTVFEIAYSLNDIDRMAKSCVENNLTERLTRLHFKSETGPYLIERLVDYAVAQICSECDDSHCQTALSVFQLKEIEAEVIEVVGRKYPEIAWLLLANAGAYQDSLEMMPQTGLIPIASKALISKTELGRDMSCVQSLLYQNFVDEVILRPDQQSLNCVEKVKTILQDSHIDAQEKVQYSIMYASSEHLPTDSLALAERYNPIFKFLITQDKNRLCPHEMLHLKLWPILSKALAALDFKNYEECISQASFHRQLDKEDWSTINRVTEAVGYDYERPTSTSRMGHSSLIIDSDL